MYFKHICLCAMPSIHIKLYIYPKNEFIAIVKKGWGKVIKHKIQVYKKRKKVNLKDEDTRNSGLYCGIRLKSR